MDCTIRRTFLMITDILRPVWLSSTRDRALIYHVPLINFWKYTAVFYTHKSCLSLWLYKKQLNWKEFACGVAFWTTTLSTVERAFVSIAHGVGKIVAFYEYFQQSSACSSNKNNRFMLTWTVRAKTLTARCWTPRNSCCLSALYSTGNRTWSSPGGNLRLCG